MIFLNRKGFTILEVAISIGVLSMIFYFIASIKSSPAKMGKQSIEEIMAFSQAKRILKILTQEYKGAQKIIFPSQNQQKGNHCAIQKKDGTIKQFYLNSDNTFVSKVLSDPNAKETLHVRQKNPRVQLKTLLFVNNANKNIDIYLKYQKTIDSQTKDFFELFDSVAIHD
ncbi:MAG: hypothetical protein COB02_14175 [Candidatus Cloacimonadota bacterium]|nr:MAG: hypothetical protein COB02_14175 [Candidatus Cloacimonadota bacterium]